MDKIYFLRIELFNPALVCDVIQTWLVWWDVYTPPMQKCI